MQQITYSGYNPIPPYRKLKGDLFYLFIKTEEQSNFHVTASPEGFFVNSSNTTQFDPKISQQYPHTYTNLLDLLIDVSDYFKQQYTKLI